LTHFANVDSRKGLDEQWLDHAAVWKKRENERSSERLGDTEASGKERFTL